jgi:hypothetical protein
MGGKDALEHHRLQLPHFDAAVGAAARVTNRTPHVEQHHTSNNTSLSQHAPAADAIDARGRNVDRQHWQHAVALRGDLHAVAGAVHAHNLQLGGGTWVRAAQRLLLRDH